MPRDITVTFSDGSSHVYRNAPDNLTPAQAEARARKDYPNLQVASMDGGRGGAKAAPMQAGWQNVARTVAAGLPPGLNALARAATELFPRQSAGVAQQVAQQATLGGADEVASTLVSVPAAVRGGLPAARQQFTQSQRDQKASREDFARRNPVLNAGAAGAGMALSAAIPVGAAGRFVAAAPSLAQAALRSGMVSAGTGAVQGFLSGDEGERMAGAGSGAVMGGLVGAAVPSAFALGNSVVQRATPMVQGLMQRAAPMVEGVGRAIPAVDDLAGSVAAGMRRMAPPLPPNLTTPEQIALQNVARVGRSSGVGVNELQNAAPDLMAAEVFGPTGARQLGALARREGLTGENLRTTITNRQQDRPGILSGAFEQATGVRPGDASEIIADIVDTGQKNARPLYEAAFNDPIQMTDNLQELLNLPALQGARRRAYRLMQNDRINPETLGFTVSPESGDLPILVPNRTPNLRVLDYIKRGLDGELRPFKNQNTGRIDTSDPEARQLVGIIREFRDELTSQSPNYRQALAVSGDYLSSQSAFEQAQRMLGNGMDEFAFNRTLARMSEGERQAFRVGAAKWAHDRAQTGKLTPQSLVGQAGARLRAKLTAALGEDSVAAIINPATREAQKAAFERRAGFVNSPTAELTLGNQEVDQALGAQNWSPGEAMMNPVGAARSFIARNIDRAVDAAVGPGREAARNEMGRLFMMSPQELAAYLEANPVNVPPPMFPGPRAPNPFAFTASPPRTGSTGRR